MSRRVAINLVFFGLVFASMLVWAVNNVVSVETLERPYEITGEFVSTSGILPRAEVAYLGLNYGTVDSVERIPGGVRITMKIDRNRQIPAGSTANVYRKSAIGEPYIDFFPPEGYEGDEGPYIQPGDHVPRERTTVPLEFSELLRSASRLVSGIEPERVKVLVHELALALDNRADDLRRLTLSGDELTTTFAARTEVLDRLASNNTRLTRVMADHREAFGQPITDLRQLAESLRRAEGDTSLLLERGSRLLRETAGLVGDVKPQLDCILSDLTSTLRVASTPEHVADLQRMLYAAPAGFGAAWTSRDVEPDGTWVRVGTIFNPNNPPRQYVPPLDLPAVPEVQPCTSELRASAVDYVPSDSQGDGGAGAPIRWPRGPAGTAGALSALAVVAGATVLRVTLGRTATA